MIEQAKSAVSAGATFSSKIFPGGRFGGTETLKALTGPYVASFPAVTEV